MNRFNSTRRANRLYQAALWGVVALLFSSLASVAAGPKESAGFVMEFAAKESDVLAVVRTIAQDSLIRGTYVYDKDKTLSGAVPAKSSDVFGVWDGPGEVFYKVLTGVLAPRHFEQSADLGTITVRYIVQPEGDQRTRVRVDAIFIEDARRKAHASDSTVETSELKAIQDKLQEQELAEQKVQEERQQAAAKEEKRQQEAAQQSATSDRQEETDRLNLAESSIRGLQQRIQALRHQVEVRVTGPNTSLKTAPFAKAADLVPVNQGAELVVEIVTPQWYGVEMPDGHRGWLRRDQAEQLP